MTLTPLPVGPDDVEPMDYQPRVKLNFPIWIAFTRSAWDITRWLFDNPYKGYLITSPHHEYVAELLAKLQLAGLIAPAYNGYQLTADGRYYANKYLHSRMS